MHERATRGRAFRRGGRKRNKAQGSGRTPRAARGQEGGRMWSGNGEGEEARRRGGLPRTCKMRESRGRTKTVGRVVVLARG